MAPAGARTAGGRLGQGICVGTAPLSPEPQHRGLVHTADHVNGRHRAAKKAQRDCQALHLLLLLHRCHTFPRLYQGNSSLVQAQHPPSAKHISAKHLQVICTVYGNLFFPENVSFNHHACSCLTGALTCVNALGHPMGTTLAAALWGLMLSVSRHSQAFLMAPSRPGNLAWHIHMCNTCQIL